MRLSLIVAAIVLFVSWKAILVVGVAWLILSFVVGVLVGKLLAKRSRDYPPPDGWSNHSHPSAHLYDQDAES